MNQISFEVQAGEIMGLIGANGAGKTTIVKMAAGVLHPDGGKVLVNGENPFERSAGYRKNVAMLLGQKGKLHPDMSIGESAEMYGSMYGVHGKQAKERVWDMAQLLNLSQVDLGKQARSLSLRQRMKGELCLSLMNMPRILFLDEPTLGLDAQSARSIRSFLRQYCTEIQATMILTSHDLADIKDTSSKLMIINQGKQLYWGDINRLPKQYERNTQIIFRTSSQQGMERIAKPLQ